KVDWPIRFMFHRDVGFSKDWLKAQLNGDCSDIGASLAPDLCGSGSEMYHWTRNGGFYEEDEDDGIKGEFWCQADYHMRIYTGGHSLGDVGFYMVAAVHKDHEPPW